MRELLLSVDIAYTDTMHCMVFLLFSALLAVYFGQARVKCESSPVSQILLCDITTLAPFLCMIMMLTKYL